MMFDECKLIQDEPFTLSSGRKSKIFYDFDLLKPRETAEYVKHLIDEIPPDVKKKIDFIATPALGGIIPGFLVAFALDKPLVIVDKEGKTRGPQVKGGRFLVTDDVITSFQAVNHVVSALPKACKCLGALAYIFRGTSQDLKKQPFPAFYLARKEEEE